MIGSLSGIQYLTYFYFNFNVFINFIIVCYYGNSCIYLLAKSNEKLDTYLGI